LPRQESRSQMKAMYQVCIEVLRRTFSLNYPLSAQGSE